MKRSELISLVAGSIIASPRIATAQLVPAMRTVGILEPSAASDRAAVTWRAAFKLQLRTLGWTEGQNVRFRILYADGDNRLIPNQAAKLVASAPDVILGASPPAVAALKERTRSIPIVFVRVTDPVGGGLISSLARPGGNITGFDNGTDVSLVAERLQFLKEIAPHVTRVAVLFNPQVGLNLPMHARTMAKASGIDAITMPFEKTADIAAIARLSERPNTGLMFLPNFIANSNRDAIVKVAARYRLPAMYYNDSYVKVGGLMSYGTDVPDTYRKAASYVDRILRGAKPGDLPVQEPSTFDFSINLKTAKALGLTVPEPLLVQANEVIR